MATIKDVAERAGVSIATVSYIINNTKPVTPATRKKVLAAINDLNYVPNKTARNFKSGKMHTIAFIVPDISNIYFAKIIEVLEARLHDIGYSLIVANTKESKEREIEHIRTFTAGIVDGIVLASTVSDFGEIKKYIPEGFPFLTIDRKLKNCTADVINASDYSAVSDGIKHLLKKGHKKIGYISDIPRLSTSKERLAAYKDTLEEYGISIQENFVKQANSLLHDAYTKTGELIEEGCTAIIVGTNIMTVDVSLYLIENNRQDIAVIGYEYRDFPQMIRHLHGYIELNETDMGISAADQIVNRIHFPDQAQKVIIIKNQYHSY